GVPTIRKARNFDYRRGDLNANIAGIFREWAVCFEPVGRNPPPDDAFRIGGNHDLLAVRNRWRKAEGTSDCTAGRCPLARGIIKLCLCADVDGGMVADPNSDQRRLTARPVLLNVSRIV